MGDVIYLNQHRRHKERVLSFEGSSIPIDPTDAKLYDFFRKVVAEFQERGFEVLDITVIENEKAN